jgi:hypothetical protein
VQGKQTICNLRLNEKGKEEGLENLPVVQEFVDMFLEELPIFHPKESWSLQ